MISRNSLMGTRNSQYDYFSEVDYREASHPVVQAYASPKMDYILKAVGLPQNARILDVGCGNGVFTYHLRKAYGFVVGLDFSSHLLGQNPHALRVRGDASTLPFPDSSFDLAFEANLLHHVPEPERVVSSMKRVSRRYVVLIEPNRLNPVMFAFSLAVRAERGGLRSSLGALKSLIKKAKLTCVSAMTTGMISQNNTPQWLVPLLKRFDKDILWGEYVVLIAQK